MKKTFNIVVAYAKKNRGIGINGGLPWKIKSDMKHFTRTTTLTSDPSKKNCVIMGRKTFDSIPGHLKNRKNIVITSKAPNIKLKNAIASSTLHDALNVAFENKDIENVFVIGGEKVYEEALKRNDLDTVIATEIDREFECDTFMPDLDYKFSESRKSELETGVKVVKFVKCIPVLV